MPQFVPVTIGGAGGVSHNYKPRDITAGVATLVESTGIPIGDRRISLSTTRSQNGKVKLVIKFAQPVVENVTVNGVTRPTVTRTNYSEMSFNFDGSSTKNDRDDLRFQMKEFLDTLNPLTVGYIHDLEGLY